MHKIITKNYKVKLLCLAIASLLWFYVAASQNTVSKLPGSIKIKAINTPQGLITVYDQKAVELKIMAEPQVWNKINADSFSAFVDLSSLSEGTYELNVNVTSTIAGVQIVDKSPGKIFVSLEKELSKEVNINKKIEGSAASGLVAGNIDLTPDKVTVKGPKSLIENLTECTALIKLNGETEDFSRVVPIKAFSEDGNVLENLEFSPSQVLSSVNLVKASNTKTVGIKVKTSGLVRPGYYISDIKSNSETIDLVGSKEILDGISSVETEPVEINNSNTTVETESQLIIPQGAALSANSQAKVKIVIKISEYSMNREFSVPVTSKNLPVGYMPANYDPAQVKIIVSASKSTLDSIKTNEITAFLDFGSKKLTQNRELLIVDLIESNIKLPANVSLVSYSPLSISVVLEKKP